MDTLTYYERHLLSVCIDHYIADIRTACAEDQGTPEGEPGTIGNTMQAELRNLKEKLR